jgi:hypothetical protein
MENTQESEKLCLKKLYIDALYYKYIHRGFSDKCAEIMTVKTILKEF